ncbi:MULTISPECIES: ABC transporter substrate-binding protein [unclassified Chelatococcus]|uniref:ABC transporter substrate-binding protein n=1 Tax=unclassified Chelatococcus TaxID=2638111 RepID=UPI0002F04B3B|nr:MULTISPECIES: ABC transporter substrate-binding protein [unclassified Chelatococcus]ALA17661.1 peptide ABC transporter [Chelatococcus sp. CO-6]
MFRKLVLAGLAATSLSFATVVPGLAQERGGVVNVAMIGELASLDPTVATGDLLGTVTQHFFETLFTFDKEWNIAPLLAEKLPEVSADGRVYTISLRKGVKFHDGSEMTAKDVVASLHRWLELASRGKLVQPNLAGLEAIDDRTVRLSLKEPFAPLAALLAFNNSAAIILPAGKMDNPLKEYVGTGPYMLKERKADQYIQLVRFDGYTPREGDPNGFGGARKQYLDEIRFVPVPDANTRVEGAIAGQYDYADLLPVEAYDRLNGQDKTEPLLLKSFGWPMFIMNNKQGMMTKLEMRKAVQAALNAEDMLAAAFGKPEFYTVDGALYPEGYPWRTDAGTEAYNLGDPEKAKELAKAAGYDGKQPIRILTSRQYEFHYKMAQVAAEYLKAADLAVELQVVDWATLVQRRADPALWDIFITHSPFLPDPALIAPLPATYPGWWDNPEKEKLLVALNAELDQTKRVALFADLQKLLYEQAPLYKVGDFSALSAKSPKLKGYDASPWPYFWNAYLDK